MIAHDLETTPLKFNTISTPNSGEMAVLKFWTSEWLPAGFVFFDVGLETPRYSIEGCASWESFPSSTVSNGGNNIRVLTKIELSGLCLHIECDGVKVVDISMSKCTDHSCGNGIDAWNWWSSRQRTMLLVSTGRR